MNDFLLKQDERLRSQGAAILFGATEGSNTLHLRSQTGGFDCFIDWGDGSTEVAPANGGDVTHSYSSAGDYVIRFYGKSWAGFNVNNATGKEKYKAIYSLGKWPTNTLTTLYTAFYGCNGLTAIAENALKYCTAVTSCFQAFRGCAGLATIPPNLFRDLTACTNFQRALRLIPALQSRADIFGVDYANRFNGMTVNFTEFMDRSTFTGVQGVAPALWDFTGLTATKTDAFNGAGNNLTSLSNYGDIPAEWI
jgi:hypothetical protein